MTMDSRIPRRRFVQAAGAAIAGTALSGTDRLARAQQPATLSSRRDRPARNIIFMVSDGMSTGTLTLADDVHRARTGRPSNWVSLFSDPSTRRAMCRTHAADSLVTDSAAAASTWGIGRKVNNGAVNYTPEGEQPTPILVTAKANGLATGLVTTTRVTHATPAGFVANVPERGLEDGIAEQILARKVDVVLGGGAKHFPPELLEQHPEYALARTREHLSAAPADGPLLGLFDDSHVPYVLGRPETVPTLPAMTRAALDRLARTDGFIVQIEGGRVDHAAHANDAGSLVAEQLEFDEALGVALGFVLGRSDTLLIVTTDHGNANPGLTLYGQAGNDGLAHLAGARYGFDWFWDNVNQRGGWNDAKPEVPALIAEMTGGFELPEADLEWLDRRFARRERADGFHPRWRDGNCVLGSVLANYYGVSFLSPNHTSDMVETTAIGPGAERLAPVIENTDLHGLLLASIASPVGAG